MTAYELRISDWCSDVCSSDLPFAPLLSDHTRQPVGGRLGQRAERIAVEIDEAVAELEAIAETRERIGRVALRGIGGEARPGQCKSLKIARTGRASAPTMPSGTATSSSAERRIGKGRRDTSSKR